MFDKVSKWWRQRTEHRHKLDEQSESAKTEGANTQQVSPTLQDDPLSEVHNQKEETHSIINLDPDIAEMISTASIVRSMPVDKANPLETSDDRQGAEPQTDLIYTSPSVDLLETPSRKYEVDKDELSEKATLLAETCRQFGVRGQVQRINSGPLLTTFEFKPDPGVKLNRVANLADDLCLALKAESIRIYPLPGKTAIAIETPNLWREKVFLREVFDSLLFQLSQSKLTIGLGKTINGEAFITDLSKLPHLLIAGATGTGKSVTLNAIICSILYKASPDEVKFIIIDPKRVELGLYEGMPHLLTPIITDAMRAANAFRWAINEMENRFREFAIIGVADIEAYNAVVSEMIDPTVSKSNPEAPKPLPYIVIAVDGFSDLILSGREEIESLIDQLAQRSRAVGIHLVLVTQRPSVDVITGSIKANIPSRIALRVTSKIDSRTIIDSTGAEALLSEGDMLFLSSTSAQPVRVHGSHVSHIEVKQITDYIRAQRSSSYDERVALTEQEMWASRGFIGEQDELFEDALAIVIAMGRASTSVLQRRLSIGYGRATEILDAMERQGFIGPAEGAKPRKVLSAAYEFREQLEQRSEDHFD